MTTPPDVSPTLWGLVRRPSPSGQERAAATWLVQHMQALGFTAAHLDEVGNAIGHMGAGPREIVLLGHIDTVPGEVPVRVTTDDAGRRVLYGRGSVDAKGPLAAFVDAVAAVGPRPGWRLTVIAAVDEERDSVGARHIVSRHRPAFAIIGEPSRWHRVTLGYKGSAWAQVRLRTPLAHTAAQAPSACEQAVALWQHVRDWVAAHNADRGKPFEQLQITLRGWASGGDGLHEWADLRLGARLPLDWPPERWYAALQAQCAAWDATVTPQGYAIPAYLADRRSPLVRAFLRAIRSQGARPGLVRKSGTADLNIVAPAWQCPAVAYGPGDSALDHTPHEHLPLDEYARAVQVLQAVLTALTAA